MIAAPPSLAARFSHERNGHTHYSTKPVIAFDDEGLALVLGDGRLVPADSYSNFANVIEDDPGHVALIPAGGWRVEFTSEDGSKYREPLVGWSLTAGGDVEPLFADADGLVNDFHRYSGEYRIYHPDCEEEAADQ